MANQFHFNKTFIESVKRMNHQIIDFNRKMQPVFSSIGEFALKMNHLGQLIKKYFDENEILEAVSRLSKGILETEEDLKVFKALMVEMGYPPHNGIDIPTMRLIV
ncbi:hypothetical protein SAMN05518871_102129 [Psychrobacillus sp. OK028]|uniref:hypothetical protein n=1 Tax=Psychrobacillus sp. OK028 TaxID=1884359 RepID=UPI000888C097|nr:hypothetical protein [Psychrobacillus sp. OK028]SDM74050.1 hypothetical protein SAMN05518871_102129 [Psychrobacillus sp. OK028]